MYELSYPVEKIFWSILNQRVDPYQKKRKLLSQPDKTIHTPIESPCRVDKKYAVLKKFYSDFRSKKPKNCFKTRIFFMVK